MNDPYYRDYTAGLIPNPTESDGFVYEEPVSLSRHELLAHHVGQILDVLGYDRKDQHFERTGERAAQVFLGYIKNGSDDEAKRLLEVQFIEEGAISSLVIEGPIRFRSMCAHHLLPVSGWAWVGYLPSARVCGLSKLARIVHYYAKQLTVQERVTQQIADALVTHLEPNGVMVVIRAEHGCMKLRGVEEPLAETTTSAVRGVFKDSAAARNEFLTLMREPKP